MYIKPVVRLRGCGLSLSYMNSKTHSKAAHMYGYFALEQFITKASTNEIGRRAVLKTVPGGFVCL